MCSAHKLLCWKLYYAEFQVYVKIENPHPQIFWSESQIVYNFIHKYFSVSVMAKALFFKNA